MSALQSFMAISTSYYMHMVVQYITTLLYLENNTVSLYFQMLSASLNPSWTSNDNNYEIIRITATCS